MTFMDKIVVVSIAGVSLVCVVAMLYNIHGSRTNVADSLHQQFMDEDVRESVTEVEEVDNDTSGPEFIGGVKNVTVSEGGNATFTCTLARRGSYKVAWIHLDTRAVLSVHKLVISANPRLSVSQHDSRAGHSVWQLHIREVGPGDAGQYECQVNTEQAMRSAGHLRVVGQQKLQCVEDGWHLLKSNKMCYKHVDELKTWRLARKYCEHFGGHLACASNVEINNFLTTLFPKSRKHGWVDNNVYLGAEKVIKVCIKISTIKDGAFPCRKTDSGSGLTGHISTSLPGRRAHRQEERSILS